MAQTTVSIRMEDTLKKDMEETCEELGMKMALNMISSRTEHEEAVG